MGEMLRFSARCEQLEPGDRATAHITSITYLTYQIVDYLQRRLGDRCNVEYGEDGVEINFVQPDGIDSNY